MASTTPFGATIVPAPTQDTLDLTLPPAISDSPSLTPAGSREDLADVYKDQRRVPPHSPFYQHPTDSLDRVHSRQNSKNINSSEKDLEAGLAIHQTDTAPFSSKVSLDCNKECKMWPSKQTLMEKKKAEKKKQRDGKVCAPVVEFWESKTARQRLIIKVVSTLLVLGVVVAIAVGITIAVKGTVYVTDNRTAKIPNPEN